MKTVWLGVLFAALANAQNWPAFRGPMGSGVADGTNAPVKFDAEKKEAFAWKTPIPGISVSSPIIWGERVFVVTSISSDPKSEFRHGLYGDTEPARDTSEHTWKLYCLQLSTGAVQWERELHKGVPKGKRHPKASYSSPTPTTDGQHVAVWLGSEGLHVYGMDGSLKWKKDLGAVSAGWFFDPDYEWGVASSPTIYRGLLFIQADNSKKSFLAAFEVGTGKQVWRVDRDELPSWGTPVVHEHNGTALLLTNATNRMRAYEPMTGKLVWELGNNSEITCTTPVAGDGLAYFANGYPPVQPIYAVRWGAKGDITLKEGEEKNGGIAWSTKRGGPYMPSPLLYQGLLYINSNNGVLSVYDAKTGERIYQQRIAGKGGAFSASPVAADGKVWLTSEDGEVHVIRAGRTYEHLATSSVGEVLMATPALAPRTLVVRGMKHVYAFRAN
jgi:outer membrane protein assembly factor BamB